jgi:hypothetical protein
MQRATAKVKMPMRGFFPFGKLRVRMTRVLFVGEKDKWVKGTSNGKSSANAKCGISPLRGSQEA